MDRSIDRLVQEWDWIRVGTEVLQLHGHYANLLQRWMESMHGGFTLHVSSRAKLFRGGRGTIGGGGWPAQDEILYGGM